MTPELWQQVKEIFQDAVEQPAAQRQEWVAKACGGNRQLQTQVERLLTADQATESPLEEPAVDLAAGLLQQAKPPTETGWNRNAAPSGFRRSPSDLGEGDKIGHHRLRHEIGHGGMGSVYLATRDDGQYSEEVAIKLIRRGRNTTALIERFRQERQILADLKHPNIARLLDGGVTEDGLPYFVMEHIDGVPIDEYCQQSNLSLNDRLELFRTVCAAVHMAHRSLVVHCDLKPSNILVTADGEPKLVDFGIARLLDSELGPTRPETPNSQSAAPEDPQKASTSSHGRLLTPNYASPEQVTGRPLTTASDIYSLGVVLYKLLTDHLPYTFADFTTEEISRVICTVDPIAPSSAVPQQSEGKILAGDLDSIVLRALNKAPENRYSSAEQLAEDLRRHQRRLPVIAREPTFTYRAGRFVQRHWLGVAAALLIVLSLVAGIFTTTWQARRAQTQKTNVEKSLEFLVSLFQASDPDEYGEGNFTLNDILENGSRTVAEELRDVPEAQARVMATIGKVYHKLGQYDRAEPLLETALETRRNLYGENRPEVAASVTDLGLLRFRQGRYDEAEPLLRQSLALTEKFQGESHTDLTKGLNGLALLLRARERYDEAAVLYEKSLRLHRRYRGENNEYVAASLNNLAAVHLKQENYKQAEVFFLDSLAMRRSIYGEQHTRIANSLNNLGFLYRTQGRYAEAEKYYLEALDIQKKRLGDSHPHVGITLNNLATLLFRKGRYQETEKLLHQALEIQRKRLGPEHPDYAKTLHNLARTYNKLENYERAALFSRQVLDLNHQLFGPEHPTVAADLFNLALILKAQGQTPEARQMLEQSLDIRQKKYPSGHTKIVAVQQELEDL